MTLGKRIQAARERLKPKMTRRALGAVFGISEQAVYEWEARGKRPDFEKLPTLARTLKVPIAWLLEGKGAPPSPDDPQVRIEALNDDQRAMLDQFLRFLQDQKHKVA